MDSPAPLQPRLTADGSDEAGLSRWMTEACFKAGQLADLGLAIMAGLVASEHVLIRVPDEDTNLTALAVEQEVLLTCSTIFSLRTSVFRCPPETQSPVLMTAVAPNGVPSDALVVPGIDRMSLDGQATILDLLVSRTVTDLSGNEIKLPSRFIVIGITTQPHSAHPPSQVGVACLDAYLADHFFISHLQEAHDEFPLQARQGHLSRTGGWKDSDGSRLTSKVQLSSRHVRALASHANRFTSLSDEVSTYIHDLVIFLRSHPAVAMADGIASVGVSAHSTRLFRRLVVVLAAIHGLAYVPPALVGLAFSKIYAHRIKVIRQGDEKERMWSLYADYTVYPHSRLSVDEVLQEVLRNVQVPL